MCWSIPGKIIEINGTVSTVDVAGVKKEVGLDIVPDAKVGEYVLVHAGYAIQKVSEDKAKFTIDFFKGKTDNA
jgi:hydrogenase expression/formation protein HypC